MQFHTKLPNPSRQKVYFKHLKEAKGVLGNDVIQMGSVQTLWGCHPAEAPDDPCDLYMNGWIVEYFTFLYFGRDKKHFLRVESQTDQNETAPIRRMSAPPAEANGFSAPERTCFQSLPLFCYAVVFEGHQQTLSSESRLPVVYINVTLGDTWTERAGGPALPRPLQWAAWPGLNKQPRSSGVIDSFPCGKQSVPQSVSRLPNDSRATLSTHSGGRMHKLKAPTIERRAINGPAVVDGGLAARWRALKKGKKKITLTWRL